MRKYAGITLAIIMGIVATTVALGQAARPDRSIKYRQAAMYVMNWHARAMNAMVKGDRPFDKDDFARRAAFVEEISHIPWEGFGPGTETGAKTEAKPEIWKDPAKFKSEQEKLVTQAGKVVTAAKSGDLAVIRGPFGDLMKTCESCHEAFTNQ